MRYSLRALLCLVCLYTRCAVCAQSTPYLDAIQARMRQVAPKAEGKLWQLSRGNTLRPSWLFQTPDCWGYEDPDKSCGRHNSLGALALARQIRDDIASATTWIDLTTLARHADIAYGMFHEAIVEGIRQALIKSPNVTIRILGGTAIRQSPDVPKAYADRLREDLGNYSAVAHIFVAGIEPYIGYSWNHAKMVAVDGRVAIVGGHNLYGDDYGGDHPVVDESMRIEGPAVIQAHRLANILWGFACEHESSHNAKVTRFPASTDAPCPEAFAQTSEAEIVDGNVSVLSLASLGYGITSFDNTSGAPEPAGDPSAACTRFHRDYYNDDAQFSVDNPDIEARRALIQSARESVFLAQQDLLFDYCNWWDFGFVSATYDARLFDILASKLRDGVRITIVTSTPTTEGDTKGYSYMARMSEITNILLRKLSQQNVPRNDAISLLCANLSLASVRIAHNKTQWASGVAFGQHAKVIAVDDAAFYIGSHNLYPTTLQEFGYIVEDKSAVSHLKNAFLDKLWLYSQESASIFAGAKICKIDDSDIARGDHDQVSPSPESLFV
eukprot:TRINITY_DN24228_c0_g2_i1.p1 TRINITY_DN24228_c0_g2~~TRINITY_DN24228_c0_g2_i1.p1  ORF type:complete len:554 (-),score=41.48 TRINITY_DN24228_c0_g2_i1:153-1814(-)